MSGELSLFLIDFSALNQFCSYSDLRVQKHCFITLSELKKDFYSKVRLT